MRRYLRTVANIGKKSTRFTVGAPIVYTMLTYSLKGDKTSLLHYGKYFIYLLEIKAFNNMKTLQVYSSEKLRDVKDFVDEKKLQKEDVLSIMQDQDGNFVLMYFSE